MSFSSALTSTPMKWAMGGWTFFLLENLILSENRTILISHLGDDNYHYLYGTCSTAAVTSIVYAYFRKIKIDSLPLRWSLNHPVPRGMILLGFGLQSVGMAMASQSLPKLQIPIWYGTSSSSSSQAEKPITHSLPTEQSFQWKIRCPFDFSDSKSYTNTNQNQDYSPRGLDRITRHPGLWSIALFGLGNAAITPSLPRSVWMSMPVFIAYFGGMHTDSRHKRGMGGRLDQTMEEQTSNMPFWAMLTGKQGKESFLKLMEEGKGLNAALAVGMVGIWVVRRTGGARRLIKVV